MLGHKTGLTEYKRWRHVTEIFESPKYLSVKNTREILKYLMKTKRYIRIYVCR